MSTKKNEDPVDQLARLGNELRELWAEEYRQFHLKKGHDRTFVKDVTADGGRDSSGRYHKCKWPDYARILLANGIDPALAVRSVFEKASARPPLPNLLISNANLNRCKDTTATLPSDLKRALSIQITQFNDRVFLKKSLYANDMRVTRRSVLCDPSIDLSPLFRYSIATMLDMDQAANQWKTLAAEQYLKMPDLYDEYWPLIPTGFKQWAREERNKLIYCSERIE